MRVGGEQVEEGCEWRLQGAVPPPEIPRFLQVLHLLRVLLHPRLLIQLVHKINPLVKPEVVGVLLVYGREEEFVVPAYDGRAPVVLLWLHT